MEGVLQEIARLFVVPRHAPQKGVQGVLMTIHDGGESRVR
jgi:hypothetical protein